MAWSDDPELVDRIEPPPDLSPGWKLDPHYGDRVRYWNGEESRRIATGEDVGEVPEAVTIHPANSKEPNPLLEMFRGKPEENLEHRDGDAEER